MIKIALPKGATQEAVREFLTRRGIDFSGYHKDARAYGSRSGRKNQLFSKQFRHKDIPIQVSIGNYDLGLCGYQWVAEYLTQYPRADIMNLRTLDIPEGAMYVCCSDAEEPGIAKDILSRMASRGAIRIVTEFPALAERYALERRFPDFRIFPVWGAAEAYPPEGAELAIISVQDENLIESNNLRVLERLFKVEVSLIANRELFENKDLSTVLDKLV